MRIFFFRHTTRPAFIVLTIVKVFAGQSRRIILHLYVGNFVYTTTEAELWKLFAVHGSVVNVHIIYDQFTRQSKCFGYVEMLNGKDGHNAMVKLNGKIINERCLVVRKASRI
jgi:RNA recognition motif-containing protein